METCIKCGKELPNGAKFCPSCGKKILSSCPNCNQLILEDAFFCPICGYSISGENLSKPSNTKAYDNITNITSKVSYNKDDESYETHPHHWIRTWARLLDIYIFSYVIVLTILLPALIFLSPTNKIFTLFEKMPIAVSGFFIIWAAFALESIYLSVFQTTPGKKLLNIKLSPLNSNKFTPKLAFARSFKVLEQGLWFGLPVFCFISIYMNLMKLRKEGSMPWDRELNIMVFHKKVPIFKWLIYVVVMGSLLFFEVSIRILTN
jgi:RNA polymerase subunit RPABC4/transcription elongation factor Spt4